VTTRRAYAKINLALSVGPPLPADDPYPGMHPIASWVHAIDLYDEVEVTLSGSGVAIEWAPDAPRPSPIDWPWTKDLTSRARAALQSECERGPMLSAAIRIVKRIPVGAGLGGGSSDAAAALLALNEACGLRCPPEWLIGLSRQIGSDVAFFLDDAAGPPRPAVVSGLGERIARLPRARGWVVLVMPGFGCSTGAVYRAYDATGPDRLREKDVERMAGSPPASALLFNDLQAAAEAVQPELRALREQAADAARAPVHMTGSGSTLFVYAPAEDDAREIESRLKIGLPGIAVRAVRLV
jgi:4-diphosphocytidyl-2-C-methyl-D-erythritol kinase